MELTTITQALPAGTRIEEFMIERVLGSGGFGITYLARDVSLNRQVVIKENLPAQFAWRDTATGTIRPRHTHAGDADDYQWSMNNFLREAETLASLDHPGIVRVLRKFEANGTAYFVMPFVEGVALDELAAQRQGKPFSEDELRGLLERVLSALAYLHERGIYHRDIKPGNLLITNDGIPVLIDFGSARQRLSERSMTVIESAGYTPFEQLQTRGNVGPWSDLYALAATLVKLMTGEAPPKTNDRSFGDPWQPLAGRAELKSNFSPGFLGGIDRALRLPIEKRWQEAGEWLKALRGQTEAEPIRANPPPRSRLQTLRRKTVAAPAATRSNHQPKPVFDRSVEASEAQLDKKPNFFAWSIIAVTLLGVFAVSKSISSEKEKSPTPTLVDEAALPQEHDRVGTAAKAEKEKRSLAGRKAGEERKFEIAPGVTIAMCWIPPGEFVMGSPEDELGRQDDENQHRVTLTQGFWLAKTEVSQAQWRAVMGNFPSGFKSNDLPVESVSWNDIAGPGGFIEKANQTTAEGGRFHLPTEAQWEYACRAETTGPYAGDLDQMAWYSKNSDDKTHPVGGKKANAWGLQDMHGNVAEWCADWYGDYTRNAITGLQGPSSSSFRVVRGGGWYNGPYYCRAASRNYGVPTGHSNNVGFRLARTPLL